MASGVLSLPVDVPWQLLAVSPDMMDDSYCDKHFPFEWRSSLAIFVYEPPIDQLPEGFCDGRITMLKVTASITGYQPSKAETDAAYAEFPDVPTEDMTKIVSTYWGCWGVLLNVAVFPWPIDRKSPLSHYPHIVSFQPQNRDLYQAATQMGEVLTASRSDVNVGKSHGTTDTTEMGLDLHSDYSSGQTPYGNFSGGWNAAGKWGKTASDSSTVQHDASKENRETNSTTTSISQLYNLLTGYHLGTNRATFLMLPRPHTLQPTDLRSFIHGLRVIEGIQEFFLIISRPKGIKGLGVELRLETGHFPEDVPNASPAASTSSFEDFVVDRTTQACSAATDISTTYTLITPGYTIDSSKGDPGHTGISEIGSENPSANQEDMTVGSTGSPDFVQVNSFLDNYDYRATDSQTVTVAGTLRSGCWFPTANQYSPHLIRKFRVFTKSTDTVSGPVDTDYMITGRSLCAAFRSGDTCITPVEEVTQAPSQFPVSVLDEQTINLSSVVMTRDAPSYKRQPSIKELLRNLQKTMSTSWRLPTRRPLGDFGFLDTDYFKRKLKPFMNRSHLQRELREVQGLPGGVHGAFEQDKTVNSILELDLATFVRMTGLDPREAAQARMALIKSCITR